MSRLYDRDRKVWVDVPEKDVTSLVAKGTHGLESGIRIPAVAPDGTLGFINSDEAERAFREDGYRWQTREDQRQFERGQNDALISKNFSGVGNAFIGGAARGSTVGTSDVAAPLIVDALGGDGDLARQGMIKAREEHPIAAGVGQLVGSLLPALVGMGVTKVGGVLADAGAIQAAPVASRTIMGLGESLGTKVVGKLGLAEAGTAKKIADAIIPKAVGSSIEGAFFGLGDGISEAALGRPEDIAENLMAGPLAGALLGGGFGAAFGAFKLGATPLKELISKVATAGDDATSAAMRGTVRNTLVPALSLKGEKELANLTRDMTDAGSRTVRDAYYFGGKEAADEARRVVTAGESQLQSQIKQTTKEVNYALKELPKEMRTQITDDLNAAQGNITRALEDTYARYQGQRTILDAALKQDQTPSQISNLFDEETEKFIKRLEKSGDPKAIRKAADLSEYMKAQKVADTARRAEGQIYKTEGRDLLLGTELRDLARAGSRKLNSTAQSIVKSYVDDLSYLLTNHPKYGEQVKTLDTFYGAFDGFRRVASKVEKSVDTNVKTKVLERVRKDPEFAQRFDVLLNNLADVAPEMEAYRAAGKNLASKEKSLRAISERLKSINDRTAGNLDADDLEEAVELFADKGLTAKASDLRELTAQLQQQGEGVFTKAVRLQKALGKDISPEFQKLADENMERGFAALEKLNPQMDDVNGALSQIAKKLGKRAVRGLVGYEVGDYLGGPAGGALGVAAAGVSPGRMLKALTVLERQSNKSFKMIDEAARHTVDVLTSPGARKVSNIVLAQSRRSLPDRRKDYEERKNYLTQLQDPEARLEAMNQRIGELPGAPMIQTAVNAQFSKTVDFLTSKLPVDPLQGQSLNAFKSTWTPSDFELAKFERCVDAAENPLSILESIQKGTVSPEEIETCQTLFPSLYKRLQTDVVNAIMDPNIKLNYGQRIQIGSLLNVPADATLNPSFIASMQQRLNADQGGRPEGSQDSVPRPSKIDINPQAMSTNVQRISER